MLKKRTVFGNINNSMRNADIGKGSKLMLVGKAVAIAILFTGLAMGTCVSKSANAEHDNGNAKDTPEQTEIVTPVIQ